MALTAAFIMPHPPLAVDYVATDAEKKAIHKTMESFDRIARRVSDLKPATIIISSPHSDMYSDYFHIASGKGARGDFSAFGAPQNAMSVEYDEEMIKDISRFCSDSFFPAGTLGEQGGPLDHGVMVPLFFINKYYRDYKLVRVSLSGLDYNDHFRFGKFIKKVCDVYDKDIVFIASGDLSHYQKDEGPYGYRPEGPLYDEKVMATIASRELKELLTFDKNLINRAGECGHRSFCILAGALDDESVKVEVLSHEATFGVGYGLAIIDIKQKVKTILNKSPGDYEPDFRREWEEALIMEMNRYYAGGTPGFTARMEAAIMEYQDKDPYVALARRTINSLILGEELPTPEEEEIPKELINTRAGAFVSIHRKGMLRGCIGTIIATRKNVAAEIIANAISASTQDPRFPQIAPDELAELDINVDVLSEPEFVSSEEELDAVKYGIIVQNGSRHGVLLPDLEGVDTVEQQISIARQKAGIAPNEPVELMRFTVERHK